MLVEQENIGGLNKKRVAALGRYPFQHGALFKGR
jgi:hypothetical protein